MKNLSFSYKRGDFYAQNPVFVVNVPRIGAKTPRFIDNNYRI